GLIEVRINSRLERCENQFVAAERTKQGLTFERCDESPLSSNDAGLRTAEELVAAETNEIGSIFDSLVRCGLVFVQTNLLGRKHRAASQIFDERNPILS